NPDIQVISERTATALLDGGNGPGHLVMSRAADLAIEKAKTTGVAWVGALVADLTINKPLGLSPREIEFRRAYLFDVNPVGTGAMALATIASLATYLGAFGAEAEAFSSYVALGTALVSAPCIALATGGRYGLARTPPKITGGDACGICENHFDGEDLVDCPYHGGTICSLCCSLDASCNDRCKPQTSFLTAPLSRLSRILSNDILQAERSLFGLFMGVFLSVSNDTGFVMKASWERTPPATRFWS
ncbi:MAG: Ldh family oxidoreductase, partial [Pseudomonadota bacterium]